MSVPIYLYDENFKWRDHENESSFYLIARKGIFYVRSCYFGKSIEKVASANFLQEIRDEYQPGFPKIPVQIIYQALQFFQEVYEVHGAEAIVILFWNEKDGYFIDAPQQEVSSAALDFDAQEIYKRHSDSVLVGSIHSHGSMSAFHSGRDLDDEINWDGIHITIGNVNTNPSFESSIQIGASRFKFPLADLVADPVNEESIEEQQWLSHLIKQQEKFQTYAPPVQTTQKQTTPAPVNDYIQNQSEKKVIGFKR